VLAVATQHRDSLEIIDLDSGSRRQVDLPAVATGVRTVSDISWSPDGSTLAVESHLLPPLGSSYGEMRVDLIDAANGQVTPVDAGDEGAAKPVFRADGTLLVLTVSRLGPDHGPIGTQVVQWDPRTRAIVSDFALDGATSLDATSDGRWVLATVGFDDIRLRLVADPNHIGNLGSLLEPPDAAIAAAW
jgi:Tol biopolymer transport system component